MITIRARPQLPGPAWSVQASSSVITISLSVRYASRKSPRWRKTRSLGHPLPPHRSVSVSGPEPQAETGHLRRHESDTIRLDARLDPHCARTNQPADPRNPRFPPRGKATMRPGILPEKPRYYRLPARPAGPGSAIYRASGSHASWPHHLSQVQTEPATAREDASRHRRSERSPC